MRAELPGINKAAVKVEIVDGALTIEGERNYETEGTKKGYFTTERAYGTFYRRISLPEEAKVGEAKATFKDGVLEVTIPASRRRTLPNCWQPAGFPAGRARFIRPAAFCAHDRASWPSAVPGIRSRSG